jgi:hypothetical protein
MILESVDAMTGKNTAADEPIISDSLRGSPRALGMGETKYTWPNTVLIRPDVCVGRNTGKVE